MPATSSDTLTLTLLPMRAAVTRAWLPACSTALVTSSDVSSSTVSSEPGGHRHPQGLAEVTAGGPDARQVLVIGAVEHVLHGLQQRGQGVELRGERGDVGALADVADGTGGQGGRLHLVDRRSPDSITMRVRG